MENNINKFKIERTALAFWGYKECNKKCNKQLEKLPLILV